MTYRPLPQPPHRGCLRGSAGCLLPHPLTVGLTFLAIGRHRLRNTTIYALAELPAHLTYEVVPRRLDSSDEHDRIAACVIDIPTLLPALLYGDAPALVTGRRKTIRREWVWHPTSRMRLFLVLCR